MMTTASMTRYAKIAIGLMLIGLAVMITGEVMDKLQGYVNTKASN